MQALAGEAIHQEPGPGDKGTILLVDDDAVVLKAYGRLLDKSGFVVETATDPRAAAALYQQKRFDVIVSDVSMPGMTGLELLRAVREQDLDLPVVLMTGGPDVTDAMQAMEYGAFRYLAKPVPLAEFVEVVARAARLHQMARVRRETMDPAAEQGRQIGDRAGLESRFGRALETLWMAYQPIVSLSAQAVFAHEALVRNDEPTMLRPDHLLETAERLGRLPELGRAIRAHVARTLRETNHTGQVFVNLHSDDLNDAEIYSPAAPLSPFAPQVVLEITERAALERISEPMLRMSRLRAMGYRIAIDDLGAGYAGLTSFAQLEPEVVKVDMSLVRGLHQSATKQKLVRSIIELCRDLGIQLIAEGIETSKERDALVRLGGDLCQGYLFARPARPFPSATFEAQP